ncbi:unnamed protein product [Chondrus crispus]|uniref:START domain-containing protein n=1 Tax=Chondrus crispus TaxID=2769 RepID=R7QRU1_CHOCR|nr:unnamed protein product [Chondrus crispus]CDF40859.1 unnamed protein product [Chondrus crispus]|eukprot:XP_005711153.1 unnamed protein product [Chondrus crispus]
MTSSKQVKTGVSLSLSLSDLHTARLSEIHRLYNDSKLFSASRILSSLEGELEANDAKCTTAELKALEAALATPFFARLRRECEEAQQLRILLEDRQGWTLSYNGSETRVWYRREPGMQSHSILTEGIIRAPLLNVAALMYEADLYERLFWYVISAVQLPLPEPGRLKRAAHITAYAPWPLFNRDIALNAYAIDGLDEEEPCFMVVSRSLQEHDGVVEPESESRVVRVHMHNSGFELLPVSPGVVTARFLYNIDPHLAFLPTALINWAARTLCRWSLRTLESRARDLSKMPKEYEERLATAEVYDYLGKRLNGYWLSKGISKEDARAQEQRAARISVQSDNFNPDDAPSGPPTSVMTSMVRGEPSGQPSRIKKSLARLWQSGNAH